MKSEWVDPEPLVQYVKDNFKLGDIVSVLGQDDLIDEIGARAFRDRLGTDVLDEYTEEEVRTHFGIEEEE